MPDPKTTAWDGRPQNPERDGWHWVEADDGELEPLRWIAAEGRIPGHWAGLRLGGCLPHFMAERRRYRGPCPEPADGQ